MRLPKAKQKPNGKWIIQVMVDGERVSKEFETENEALYWASGVKTKTVQRKPKTGPTLSTVFDRYIAQRSNILSPATLKSYKNIRDNYFETLMTLPIDSISKEMVQEEINKMAVDKAHKTIKNAVALLLSVLSEHKQFDIRRFTFPQKENKEHAFLEGPDIARLIDAVRDDPIEIPVLLALWLGMRRSEICALEWSDFDFKKKTVSINKAMVPNEDNVYIVKNQTKTAKSKRTINVPDYVISRLEASQSDFGKRVGKVTTLHPNSLYDRLKTICDRENIPFVGIHGLRHTNASVMLSIGVTAKMAMARGGWSSNKTMQDVYQHLFSEDKAAADKAINEYFEKLILPGEK